MNRPTSSVIAAALSLLATAQVSLAQSTDYSFLTEDGIAVMEGYLLFIGPVEPLLDDDGEIMSYEIEATVLPLEGEPIVICLTSELAPDPGDLLEIDELVGPGGPDGTGPFETTVYANKFSLIDVSPRVKLKDNQKLRVAFFGSAVINPETVLPSAIELGDPTLEALGGSFVDPVKAVYPDLNGDGFRDALLTWDVGELLDAGAIDVATSHLEFRFEFRGILLSNYDTIDVRD